MSLNSDKKQKTTKKQTKMITYTPSSKSSLAIQLARVVKDQTESKTQGAQMALLKGSHTLSKDTIRSALGARPLHFRSVYVGNLDSNGSGIINVVQSDAGGLGAAGDWTGLVAIFSEVKLLGVLVHAHPRNKYSKTTTNGNSIVMYHDDSTNSPSPTSYIEAAQYSTAVMSNTDDLYPRPTWYGRPTSPIYIDNWQPSTSLTLTGAVGFYANNLTASTTFGQIYFEYHYEMRLAR